MVGVTTITTSGGAAIFTVNPKVLAAGLVYLGERVDDAEDGKRRVSYIEAWKDIDDATKNTLYICRVYAATTSCIAALGIRRFRTTTV